MINNVLINDVPVMSRGQITLPEDVRIALGIDTGDRITFIIEDNQVRIINSMIDSIDRLPNQEKNSVTTCRPCGIAKGKFVYPEDFDEDNEEIARMLTEGTL